MMEARIMLVLSLLLSVFASAQSYTESTLYNFSTTQASPGGLVRDSAGNLYGTTYSGGGSANCSGGCGTIFKLSSSGTVTTLYAFTGNSGGANPCCLVMDKYGNLFGTTALGGLGYGTVFKFTATKKFSTLHQFGRLSTDGLSPTGPLTMDSSGNLYGMTLAGGATGYGILFEVTSAGKESILYSFTSASGPPVHSGNLLRDGKGNFYGIGANGDLLFQLSSSGTESTLASGLDQGQGQNINSGYIARNSAGNFYGGFTYWGNCGLDDCNAWSGLWEVNGNSKSVTYYFFTANCDPVDYCINGIQPAGPLLSSGGNLYGTMDIGGSQNWGMVYEFDPTSGVETVLYSFLGSEGSFPASGLVSDAAGNLYGTTAGGGSNGSGTAFKLTKNN